MPAIRISPEELKQKMEQEKFIILDLRQPEVYESSQEQIKGSIRLDPNDDEAIRRMIDNTDKNAAIVGYCTWHNEYTSARVANIFVKHGFHNVRALLGGLQAWKDAGYPVKPKK